MTFGIGNDETHVNNDNRTTNTSTSLAGQSNDGHVSSVNTDGNVSITNNDLSAEAIADGFNALNKYATSLVDITEDNNETVVILADEAGDTHQDNLNFLSDQISSIGGAVKDLIDNTLGIGERNNDRFLDSVEKSNRIVSNALDRNTSVTLSAFDLAEDLTERHELSLQENTNTLITSLADLSEDAALDRRDSLAAIAKLSETVVTGGENLQTNLNKMIGVAAIFVLGVVAYQAVQES